MNWQYNNKILKRVTILSAIILVCGLVGVFFFSQWLFPFFPTYYASIQTASMLFIIWLVITSTLRSLQQLMPHIAAWILLLVGIVVTALGLLVYWTFLGIYGVFKMGYAVDFSWEPVAVFTALGTVVSLMTLINLRIKDRTIGNVLELVLVLVIIGIIVYLVN